MVAVITCELARTLERTEDVKTSEVSLEEMVVVN